MRALVLGGGGVIGVAWETGLVAGLADGGLDLRDADVIVGTSAGSLIGTRLAAGQDLRTPPVEALIRATGGAVGVDAWPKRDLRITAVDIETGRFAVHTAKTGAGLAEAIASSCSVPGMFPPVPIAGRRYMDGGVRSGTNADVLLDGRPDRVLVIAPLCKASAPIGAVAERSMNDEIARLRAAGAKVVGVIPGASEIAAFGGNLMDPSRVEATREAGYARGLSLARGEAGIWLE